MPELIQTKVATVRFRNDTGWSILRTDRGTAKGVIAWTPEPGELLELEGDWQRSSYTGDDEFAFKAARTVIPTDSRALLEYAVSITKGLGPARESEIWSMYADDWRTVEVLELRGIAETTHWHWQDTLRRLEEQQAKADTIAFLLGHGSTLAMATAAWQRWEGATYGIVAENVYRLAELPHYGFAFVDTRMRAAFGIGDDDPRRFDAAMLYAFGQLTARGDTAVMDDECLRNCANLVGMNVEEWEATMERLVGAGQVVSLGADMFALATDYEHERGIWERWK